MPYSDPKPSRQQRQKRRDRRLTDGLLARPRRGRYRKQRRRPRRSMADWEEMPRREPMVPPGTDVPGYYRGNYRVLRNYLRQQVGRTWDKVHAALTEQLRGAYRQGRPVLDRVAWFVRQRVYWHEGQLYDGRFPPRQPLPTGTLYVDAATGRIRRHEVPARKKRPTKAARRGRKRRTKYLSRRGRLPAPLPVHTLPHPAIATPRQVVAPGNTYGLRISRGDEHFILRARLVQRGFAHGAHELYFQYRKGRLPEGYRPQGDAAGRVHFELLLYPDGQSFLEPYPAGWGDLSVEVVAPAAVAEGRGGTWVLEKA